MNVKRFAGAFVLALLLAACGKEQAAAPEAQDASKVSLAPNAVAEVYSGTGKIQSISGDKVAIAHGPINGIGWPAMTMTFNAPSGMARGVQPGAQVDFSFRQEGGSFVLTWLHQR